MKRKPIFIDTMGGLIPVRVTNEAPRRKYRVVVTKTTGAWKRGEELEIYHHDIVYKWGSAGTGMCIPLSESQIAAEIADNTGHMCPKEK